MRFEGDQDSANAGISTNGAVGEEVRIPVSALLPADSPRLSGENGEHARMLAESLATLPPIVVHRPTMRVIDGMHRLQAALLRGETTIAVRFYEGDEGDAFVLAVEANIAHGLPLSLADRTAAATRIVHSHPQWSDRKIASVTGLADRTVRAIRQRSTAVIPQSNTRLGRDGRSRPVDSAAGRTRASELIAENPNASVREIAKAAGVSPSTVADVRKRMRAGEDPLRPKQRAEGQRLPEAAPRGRLPGAGAGRSGQAAVNRRSVLEELWKDPSLRFSDAGRNLIRWLDKRAIDPEEWTRLVDDIPVHCAGTIEQLARSTANAWHALAENLERQRKAAGSDPSPQAGPGRLPAC